LKLRGPIAPPRVRLSAALVAAVALLFRTGPGAAADGVKLLLPQQYASRVVAPKKGRVLLVNFWATWCIPCREEMPALQKAAKAFRAKDLAVVLVSTDTPKTAPAVPKFLASLKNPFVCWLAKSRDPQVFIDTVDRTWDGSLPYTMLYDRSGRPAVKLSGQQTEASFTEAIRKALSS
jgi:thiol-disulfide isomerase/thioredoxin